ncbi:ribonuclease HII, partial [Candidatus Saccharibacteria bacterium]|nr:ribonuclease HII [Candidatus Saccharibacteria bacterium]
MAILGIDEVGRGPLAGPLVVGAVILPEERPEWVLELRDSKKLSAKKREKLNEIILKEALATGIGWVFPNELDEIGISEALRLATSRAVKSVQRLHVPFSQIIIDGKVNFLKGTALEKYVSTAVKADDLIKEVSAASIIAKVSRDNYMKRSAQRFPEYGFEKHVGYGTAKHLEALSKFGICPEHRKSFEPIKSMVGFSRENTVVKNTTMIGNKGEDVVVS